MIYKIIHNDIRRSKVITLATAVFIAAAAMLVSLTAILFVNLSGAIDGLMEQAKTPHFMQMHSGGIDSERLEAFAENTHMIDDFQITEFLNVDSSAFIIDGTSLAGSVQDNGFITQNDSFDFLLDLEGNVIAPAAGEVYVPLAYLKDGTAEAGDRLSIGRHSFVVAGFLRDSQMNSSLASSKRFLISDSDHLALLDEGTVEYLIEFRLEDLSLLSEFENLYVASGLEGNGPTITYPLFKLINGISDGLMIAVILLIASLMTAISLMCIRFSLLTKIEEDYREIGVMKAMGLPPGDIRKIYLAKYMFITAAGCVLGFVLAAVFKGIFLENIRLFLGESPAAVQEILFGLLGILLIFLMVILYVVRVLSRISRISASEAIRYGNGGDKVKAVRFFRLTANRFLNTNIFLGIQDVLSRKKLYLTMLFVLILSTFIMIVPQNLYTTVSSDSFVTYMGVGNSAMRIDIQQTADISEKADRIMSNLERDEAVSRYVRLETRSFQAETADGEWKNLKIELGNHGLFPVSYSEGRAPSEEGEIALSVMNAEELGKGYGDTMSLIIEGEERNFVVCGLYSDITNGGKTAKAVIPEVSADTMWSIFYVDFYSPEHTGRYAAEYAAAFPFAKVSPIDEYVEQTFGTTLSSVRKASVGGVILAAAVSVLVTILFMKMIVAKDRYAVALLKANGFTRSDIQTQYVARSLFILIIGLILGVVLSNTIGELLGAALISFFGASTFQFEVNGLKAYLLFPAALALAVSAATLLGTRGIDNITIYENIKE